MASDMSESDDEAVEKQLKIVFLGDSNVGKTSLVRRLCFDEFSRQYNQTVGAEFYLKKLELSKDKEISIKFFDIGGSEFNGHMLENYLFNSDIILLVYDITNSPSLDNLVSWLGLFKPIIGNPVTVAICGNKIIEKYTENIRFCIICNYLSKIIPALQSRCTRFRFGPLSPDQILPRLNYVVDEEKVTVTEDGKKALLTLANGDMRKVLNVLQSTWLAYKNVTEDNVYTCVGHPLRADIENIVKWLLTENFKTAYQNIKELKMLKGLALHDIITEVHKYVHRIEFPFNLLIDLLDKLAEIEHRLCSGANENIQLTATIAAFQFVRDVKPIEESS